MIWEREAHMDQLTCHCPALPRTHARVQCTYLVLAAFWESGGVGELKLQLTSTQARHTGLRSVAGRDKDGVRAMMAARHKLACD